MINHEIDGVLLVWFLAFVHSNKGLVKMDSDYLAWIDSAAGPARFNYAVDIDYFEETGRGLKALKDISAGDLILQIPAAVMLTSLNIRFSSLFNEISPFMFPPWAFSGKYPSNHFIYFCVGFFSNIFFLTIQRLLKIIRVHILTREFFNY